MTTLITAAKETSNVLRKYVQRCRRPNDNDNANTEGAEVLCMRMFGIAQNMVGLIQNNIKQWKTVLTTGGEALGEVHIRRRKFQGDSLSSLLFSLMRALTLVLRKVKAGYDPGDGKEMINHLLFMDDLKKPYGKNENQIDSLVPSVRIVAEDMPMEFGIPKPHNPGPNHSSSFLSGHANVRGLNIADEFDELVSII